MIFAVTILDQSCLREAELLRLPIAPVNQRPKNLQPGLIVKCDVVMVLQDNRVRAEPSVSLSVKYVSKG